jgi:hypothetical protein
MEQQYDQLVLEQFYSVQEKIDKTMEDFIVNIFTLYDMNGDGELSFHNFALFIGDLLYISVLMKRMDKTAYTEEMIVKYARWAGGNFPNHLFSGSMTSITYYIFTKGILYALNEYQHNPIFDNKCNNISLFPEFMNYFNYYNDIAIRRRWPLHRRTSLHTQQTQPPQIIRQIPPNTRNLTVEGSLHITGDVVIGGDLTIGSPPNITENSVIQQTQDVSNIIVRPMTPAALAAIARANQMSNTSSSSVQDREPALVTESIETTVPSVLTAPPPSVPSVPSVLRPEAAAENSIIDQQLHFDEPPKQEHPEYKLEDAGVIDMCNNELGFDAIEGDVNIIEYINDDKNDNLAFKIGHGYYLTKKSQIMTMINRGQPGNSIFYACSCAIIGDWTTPDTWSLLDSAVNYNESFFNIQHIGLPIRYVRLNDIACVLGGTENYFLIEKHPDAKPFPSFASDNVLNHGLGSSSSSHCQDGQEDCVYDIKTFSPSVIVVEGTTDEEPKMEETPENKT